MSSYIDFKDVRKVYQVGEVEIVAANNVTFNVEEGEFAVVVGSSGAGKTTVLNILGGIDMSDGGTIFVDGEEVNGYSEKEMVQYRRHAVGFVFQFYNLIPNLTAKENVELAKQIAESDVDVDEILEKVGLGDRKDNFPAQLSGGEQQRVAIARALAKKPKLLLCDEPTGALDYATGKMILQLLQETSKKEGMTVVLITHNAAIIPMADRVIRMKSGQVIENKVIENPVSVSEIEW